MRRPLRIAIVATLAAVLLGAVGLVRMLRYGLSTHDEPPRIEAFLARTFRHYAVPADLRDRKNPMALTSSVLKEARAHFADHCASCHGNDGRGRTSIGQRFYPKAPDMTTPETQSQTDGELFATIENGIRLTGMPAWGDGTARSAHGSWTLVHFIRHLPQITPEEIAEMEALNPRTPAEFLAMREEQEFLEGGDEAASTPAPAAPHHH